MSTLQTESEKLYMQRIRRLKDQVIGVRPFMDLENSKILTESFMQTEGEPTAIRKAKAFREQCRRKTIQVQENELLVGCSGSAPRAGILCADICWSILDREIDTISQRRYDPFYLDENNRRMFLDTVKPYWKGKSNYEKYLARMPEDMKALRDTGMIYIDRKAVRGFGETTAGYDVVIQKGIYGIVKLIDEARAKLDLTDPYDYDKDLYLQALLIVADGIVTLADRYALEAARLAALEKDDHRKKELEKIADICRHVPANPARTFHEALQSFYFYQICIFMEQNAASYNPGRMDQYLYPYYKADLEAGRITQDQAQELLNCLWVKFSEPCLFQDAVTAEYSAGYPMFQNVCAGGTDQYGRDAVNDLSYMILQATMDVQLYQPSLSVRYSLAKNPGTFLRKCAELIREGTGFPAFHNDEVGIRMMQNKGVPLRDAWNWNPCGCVETNLMGLMRSSFTAFVDMNLGGIVEFVMTNGRSRKYDRTASIETGDPRSLATFEDFMKALKAQIAYMVRCVVKGSHVVDECWREHPVPALSLSFLDCIEKGKDYAWGGPKYTTGNGIILIGVADLINSVAAVKHLVYDTKQVTMDELAKALDADFVGYERIQELCLAAPKYGNDEPEVDNMATELFGHIADEIEKYHSKFGTMTPGILPVSGNTPFGLEVGALPSGRKGYTPLTDGVSPTGGTDTEGPTAVLKSVASLPHDRFVQGTLLNMKMEPAMLNSEKGLTSLMALLRSMCALGVFHVQFNVITPETLIEAQAHPEEHKDLLVRVAGYTAYFVELGKDVQDEIISRTTQTQEPTSIV